MMMTFSIHATWIHYDDPAEVNVKQKQEEVVENKTTQYKVSFGN